MDHQINRYIEINPEACKWAMLGHVAVLAGLFIPFGNILGPLGIWLYKKKEYSFVDKNAKQALNFQITMALVSIIFVIAFATMIVIAQDALLNLTNITYLFVMGGLTIFMINFISVIICAVKAYAGKPCNYPFSVKFIK